MSPPPSSSISLARAKRRRRDSGYEELPPLKKLRRKQSRGAGAPLAQEDVHDEAGGEREKEFRERGGTSYTSQLVENYGRDPLF